MPNNPTQPEWWKELRLKKKFTHQQMADELGIKRTDYGRCESEGTWTWKARLLKRYIELFDFPQKKH